ncbi:MAG: hypothetical protein JXA03_09245 [Bacteroidales bacterium]|nr:hypothetical protein [Bacteroidales bacterium]
MVIFALVYSCENRPKSNTENAVGEKEDSVVRVAQPGPPVIIYKTKNNYYDKVPVILSEDKESIASYPDIRDVYRNGQYSYPTRLNDGFLLDNRGIDRNVAFLKLTYGEYSKLEKTPSGSELMEMILDPDPLTEMYHCGSRSKYKDVEGDLNGRIDAGDFTGFEKVR